MMSLVGFLGYVLAQFSSVGETTIVMLDYFAAPSWLPSLILAVLITQRAMDLVIAKRNTKRLIENGGHEVGAALYPFVLALHASWMVALIVWVLSVPPHMNMTFVLIYAALLGLRAWVITSLGPFWTTRIITIPNLPLVRRGPYKFLKHPSYIVVSLETAVVPLMLDAWELALIFSVLNAVMLRSRIRIENKALAVRS